MSFFSEEKALKLGLSLFIHSYLLLPKSEDTFDEIMVPHLSQRDRYEIDNGHLFYFYLFLFFNLFDVDKLTYTFDI